MNPVKPFCKQTALWLCLVCTLAAVPRAANAALNVASPVPNQVLYMGSRCAITWTSDLSPDATLTIKLLGVSEYLEIGVTMNSGYFEWDVPVGIPSTGYELAFFDGTGQVLPGGTVPVFIDTPRLYVDLPNPDSVLLKGKPYTITWYNFDPTPTPLEVFLVDGPAGDVLEYLGSAYNFAGTITVRIPRKIHQGANYRILLKAPNYSATSQPFVILQRLPRLPR